MSFSWDCNGFLFMLLFFRCCSECNSQMLPVTAMSGAGLIAAVNHYGNGF